MRIYIFVIIIFLPTILFAQRKSGIDLADSLKKQLQVIPPDTLKVKVLKKLSDIYSNINTAEGLVYANQTLDLSKRIKWDKGVALGHMAIAINSENRSDYPTALEHYMDALRVNERIGYAKGVAASNWGIADVYRLQHVYSKCQEFNLKALAYYEKVGDKESVSSLSLNMGNSYILQDKLDSALVYFSKALALKKESGDLQGVARVTQSIGVTYLKKGDFNTSLAYHFRSLRLVNNTGERTDYESILGNIGQCYLAIAKDSQMVKPDSLVLPTKKANLVIAIRYLDSALKASRKVGNLNDSKITSADMAEALELSGDYKGALQSFKEYSDYKDSIFSLDNTDKIAELEVIRAKELKDKDIQIAALKADFYIICIVLLLVIMTIGLFMLVKQVRSNKRLALEKVKYLKRIGDQNKILEYVARVQSHDLRSNIATILGLSELFNADEPQDPFNREIINGIHQVAMKMDVVVRNVIDEENKLIHDNIEHHR